MDHDAVVRCLTGQRARDLLVMNDIATVNAHPTSFPWFTINGKSIVGKQGAGSSREKFLLGNKICKAYVAKTGKKAPPGCSSFPQNEAQLGQDPWQFYKHSTLAGRSLGKKYQSI